ncbi:MAG TPA: hypothetical protein VF092_27820 [Longimicrobium sp.]
MSRLADSTGSSFATGEARCSSRPATLGERLTRLFVEIAVGDVATAAVLDTGGAYLVLSPSVGAALGLDDTVALGRDRIMIRGFALEGTIHRLPVTMHASAGEPLTFEATAFVPELDAGTQWMLPSYLGWQGCLERIRFAIDPGEELIYFGARRT